MAHPLATLFKKMANSQTVGRNIHPRVHDRRVREVNECQDLLSCSPLVIPLVAMEAALLSLFALFQLISK